MKVCMLAPEFLPVWGGVGTYTVELIRHLPRTFEIHVVTPSREALGKTQARTADYDLDSYFPDNVHIHLVSSAADTFFYNAAFQHACFKYVPKLVKEERIDLTHSHAAHMPDILLQFRKLKIPTVTTVHTTIVGQRRGTKASGMNFRDIELSEKLTYIGYPLLRLAERIFFSANREYVTVSNWMRTQLLDLFPRLASLNIRVIENAVNTEYFSPSGKTVQKKTVLFTGRIIAAKGVRYLIDAIPGVIKEHPQALFTFVGPGDSTPYEKRLNLLQVPKENYQFLGYLRDQKELLQCYRNCSVFVAPTLYENLPIRILEAMACGRPVVATNVCAIPEAIDSKKNGVLVPPRSVGALCEAISSLLKDSNRAEELGRNARQTVVERFNWVKNAPRMAQLYDEVAGHDA